MGAEHSRGKHDASRYGQLFLQTDKSSYFGGETVTGKIFLNLLMPYPGNQLYLKLKGKEAVHMVVQRSENYNEWENGQQVTRTRYVDELLEEKDNIIKMTVPMYSWATLMPGQFVIPFAFALPANLPSSFHQEGHKYLANITYRLEAILEPSIKNEPRLKYKQNFVVRQPVKNVASNVGNEVRTQITGCCCSAKGSNVLRTNFEKTWYSPGETAQVIMQLDNSQCQVNNTRIAFCLKQRLTLKAVGRSETKNFTKVERDLPGVPAGGQSNSNLIALNLPPFQGGDYSKIKTYSMISYLNGLNENNNVLNSETKSKLIHSEYYLEVSCPMDGCCTNTPANSTNIDIYYPEIQLVQAVQPTNWQPQVVENVNLAFGGPQVSVGTVPQVGMTMNMGGNQQVGMTMNVNMDANMMGTQVQGQQYGNQYYQSYN